MVVQADPKTRQYKVMAFGSRRLTLRNRRFLRKYTPINSPPGNPSVLTLGMRLGGQSLVQSTPTTAPVVPAAVSNQPTACTPAYCQPSTHQQMFQNPPVAAQIPGIPMPPLSSSMTMSPPVGTKVSMRSTKGQTNRYDDFVQQLTLRPGTYVSDGNNLYMLEEVGNKSNVMNMVTTIPPWQQKLGQNLSPDTAYACQLTCDSHHQTPWSPTYWNNDITNQLSNMMINNIMNVNIMPSSGQAILANQME